MSKYNFYARPKDSSRFIIVTGNNSIHTLKFILLDSGLYKYYTIIDEPLVEDCFVEEHHCYRILNLGWTINGKEGWYDEDCLPFNITISPNNFIKGIKEFIDKPFDRKRFFNLLNSNNDFFYNLEAIVGNDIDYMDLYFSRSDNWSLTKVEVKEIRTITYKNLCKEHLVI